MDVLIGHYWTMSDIYERDNAACIKYLNLKRSRKLFLAVLFPIIFVPQSIKSHQPSRDRPLCLLSYFSLILFRDYY